MTSEQFGKVCVWVIFAFWLYVAGALVIRYLRVWL